MSNVKILADLPKPYPKPFSKPLPFAVKSKGRRIGPIFEGKVGRFQRIQQLLTELFRLERIEKPYNICLETRGYAELLIQEAITHGDQHENTMELADFWLLEKDLIHKLFSIFVPRFATYSKSFTSVYKLPQKSKVGKYAFAYWGILELRGNPWPPVIYKSENKSNYLPNILIRAAQIEYQKQKYSKKYNIDFDKLSQPISEGVLVEPPYDELDDNTILKAEKVVDETKLSNTENNENPEKK